MSMSAVVSDVSVELDAVTDSFVILLRGVRGPDDESSLLGLLGSSLFPSHSLWTSAQSGTDKPPGRLTDGWERENWLHQQI